MKAITRIVSAASVISVLAMAACSMPAPISVQPEQQQQTPAQMIGEWLRNVLQPYVRQPAAPAPAAETLPAIHWPAQGAEFDQAAPLVRWPPLGAEVVGPTGSQAAGTDLVDRHPGLTTLPPTIQLAGDDLLDRHPSPGVVPPWLVGPVFEPQSVPAGDDLLDRHPAP